MTVARQALTIDIFIETMGKVVAAIYQETDAKISALEIKIARLEAAAQELRFVGPWQDHMSFQAGNFCTHGGSIFHCNADNTGVKPGTDANAWTLAVARGRDGKDAAPQEPPPARVTRSHR